MKKAITILVGVYCWGGSMVYGQQPPTGSQLDLSAETRRQIEQSVVYQTDVLHTIFGLDVKLDGALPRTIRAENRWQMINPFAPMDYGDGFDNVSIDPHSGKPNGISLFGIRF